ncbi:MAG: hypothetical protein ACU85E_06245 [Gammaproteobacteria bacterium]
MKVTLNDAYIGARFNRPASPAVLRVVIFIFLIIGGCTAKNTGLESPYGSRQEACLQFYRDLDRAVFAYGAEDTGEVRVAGFPYLRSNRFLASFGNKSLSKEAYTQWLEQLRQLDEHARTLEFANLSVDAAATITSRLPTGSSFRESLQTCGRLLVESNVSEGSIKDTEFAARIAVPDNYQLWKRILGVYPLTRFAARIGIDDLHRKMDRPFQLPVNQIPVSGRLVRYTPRPIMSLTLQEIGGILQASYQNPLQIPMLTPEQFERLAGHFAPVWEIDTRNRSDLIGAATFDSTGNPGIDTEKPTVYVKRAYTRFHGESLLQLIYQIWMPSREKTGLFDLYGGDLDSVIWRVTLNRRGLPIAYDSIHACGCYYMLFPGKGYRALSGIGEAEPVLAPKRITTNPLEKRLLLRLATRTHYLQQVSEVELSLNAKDYRLSAYDKLRSLPTASGLRRNLFGPGGIIDISRRTERFFLWPFGVASPGAMRQWGSHAIAFIGRRHFDDPFLLEKLIVPQKN